MWKNQNKSMLRVRQGIRVNTREIGTTMEPVEVIEFDVSPECQRRSDELIKALDAVEARYAKATTNR